MDIVEVYKKHGISGVMYFINETYGLHKEDGLQEYINKLFIFITGKSYVFCHYPEAFVDALYHSSLFEYPEINRLFEELKKESKRKPIEPLWNLSEPLEPLVERQAHKDLIQGLVTIGGNRFVTSSEDGLFKVWEYSIQDSGIMDLNLIYETYGHDHEPINNVAYHPERKWLASCGDDHIIRLWNAECIEEDEVIAEFSGHTDYVSRVLFCNDLLFSSSKDGRIGVWDLNTLQNKTFLEGHNEWVMPMQVSPDKKRLFSVSTNNQLLEWDIENFTLCHTINEGGKNLSIEVNGQSMYITRKSDNNRGHEQDPNWVEWETDNKLYSAAEEVIEWNCKTWDIHRRFAYDYNCINCFIIQDSFLVTFSKSIRIFNLHTEELINEYISPDSRTITVAVLSQDKKFVVCSDEEGYITIWDWHALIQGNNRKGQSSHIQSMEVFYKDGDEDAAVVVTGGFISEALIWDLKTGKLKGRINRTENEKEGEVRIAKVYGQEDQVFMMYSGAVCKQSLFNPTEKMKIELPNNLFHASVVVPTKNGYIFGTQCYQPLYWNPKQNSISTFDTKFAYTNEFCISPDQKYVLITTYPMSFSKKGDPFKSAWTPLFSPLILIDREKEKRIGTFWSSPLFSWIKVYNKGNKIREAKYPSCVTWSPDSNFFAGGFREKICVWNTKTKKCTRKIKMDAEDSYISHMAWQDNGLITAMLSGKGEILQINPETGDILHSVAIKGTHVTFKNAHQNGRYWLWVSDENIVGIFDTLKFEVIFTTITEVYARSVLVEKDKLLIGGEDGLLYGYSIEGVLL